MRTTTTLNEGLYKAIKAFAKKNEKQSRRLSIMR